MFKSWLGLPGFCLKAGGKHSFQCSIKIEGVISHGLKLLFGKCSVLVNKHSYKF